ncbi:MAG: hypothetical protein AB1505_31140 [Candidatus Latescibacterota bacterium]
MEGGEAVQDAATGMWVYTATSAVPAGTTLRTAVTAMDLPGGKGQATQEKAI